MNKLIVILSLLLVPLTVIPSFAARMKVFVADINATGVQNRDEMKQTLQMLLASRLAGDKILAVDSASEADAVVSGTYVSIGKVFSIDTITKNQAGKTVARAFVQGRTEDELIPAVSKLAEKLSAELVKIPAAAVGPVSETFIKQAPDRDLVKSREQETATTGGWVSKRLPGAANLMASGLTMPNGNREIFLAEGQRLVYYQQGNDMKLVAEVELKSSQKIISLDTLIGNDGNLDIYVTIISSGELVSQVWQVRGDKLVLIADKIPYFFRTASLSGEPKKLYAQTTGRDADFFGDVSEATRTGSVISIKNPIKLPRDGTIYSFNQFRDRDDKTLTVLIDNDNYLVVYNQELQELWRSNDKFGGSELFFQKDDFSNIQVTGDRYRWIFMNQRIHVSSKGEIMVGKNEASWVMGNSRSYKRGAVYCLVWNGSSLEEKWHTRETQNYMADYLLDEGRNELLILQTVQRPGIFNRGASSLSIRKIE